MSYLNDLDNQDVTNQKPSVRSRSSRASWPAFFVGMAVVIVAGVWATSLYETAEFVHFSVNFPTEPGFQQQSPEELGGSWTMLDPDEWQGYPAGGLLVWGREGKIVVDVGRRGIIKKLIAPGTVTISSHWIRNVGTIARPIGLNLNICGLDVQWETFEKDWDMRKAVSTRTIEPGKFFNMDWHVSLPPTYDSMPVICNASLEVTDAETARLLTLLPIDLINSTVAP